MQGSEPPQNGDTVDTKPKTYPPPPAGWKGPDSRGHFTFTMHGSSIMATPPTKDGYVPYFIARNGMSHTTWTYKPAPTPEEIS